jgi:hypothetical protein
MAERFMESPGEVADQKGPSFNWPSLPQTLKVNTQDYSSSLLISILALARNWLSQF